MLRTHCNTQIFNVNKHSYLELFLLSYSQDKYVELKYILAVTKMNMWHDKTDEIKRSVNKVEVVYGRVMEKGVINHEAREWAWWQKTCFTADIHMKYKTSCMFVLIINFDNVCTLLICKCGSIKYAHRGQRCVYILSMFSACCVLLLKCSSLLIQEYKYIHIYGQTLP